LSKEVADHLESHDKFVTGRNWYSDGPIDSFRLLPFDSTALTVGAQTLVFTDNRDNEDIQGGYLVRFVFGMEVEWEIRTKPSQFHTRFTVRVRGVICSISALYILSQPEAVGGA